MKVKPNFVYESPIFLHHDHDIESTRPLRVKIGDSFTKSGFVQIKIDLCVYREMKNGVISCIIIYVDDLLITLIEEDANEMIKRLGKEYEIKNHGEISCYLGISIKRLCQGFLLYLKNKIEENMQHFNLKEAHLPILPI